MARRVIGMATGSWRRRWGVLLSLALIVGAGLVFMQTLQAVHDEGIFELEGNAVTDSPLPSHDWQNVFQGNAQATAATFVSDGSGSASIFTGGGSKDPLDINQWAWKNSGGLPDKDNLTHAFAARYTVGGADILYFGSDRFDNSGDAQQGFWFFQKPVSTNWDADHNGLTAADPPCPTSVGGGTGFCDPLTGLAATHQAGDVLVISQFSNGGDVSTIRIYKWDPTVSGNLLLISDPVASANCLAASAGDQFCGVVNPNNGTATGGWDYTDKTGNHTYLQGELFEAGIDLTQLGLANECFSTVAAESRSSTSTTATLKDFVMGTFGECTSGVKTYPQVASADPSGFSDVSGPLSIGTGSVSVRDRAVVTITGAASWSGSLKFTLCGPADLTTQASCVTGGTFIGDVAISNGTAATTRFSPAATITSAGAYCWRAEFTTSTPGVPTGKDDSTGECFSVLPVTPGLVTTATTSVVIGNPISDTATLSLTANHQGSPVINPASQSPAGGSIVFRLYGPSATVSCTDANLVFTSNPATAVSGNGTYGPVSFTPTAAGTYRWIATYSGDSPNTNGTAGVCGESGEVTVINPKQPTISTLASANSVGVPLGTAINDTATLSGTSVKPNGSPATGTITFRVYGPSAAASCVDGVGGNLIGTSVVNVSGDGTNYQASTGTITGTLTPTAAGKYWWTAEYSGDAPNTLNAPAGPAGTRTTCGDTLESSIVISLTPTIATSQFFYPNDSATVTVASGGGDLAGSVRFRVWTNATCTGTPLVDQSRNIVTQNTGTGTTLSRTTETTNTTVRVTGSIFVYWQVDYDSTNAAHEDVLGTCGKERSEIIVNNNYTPPAP